LVDFDFIEHRFLPAMDLVARYHRFETRGIERVPATGRLLILTTHSLMTYELLLGLAAVFQHTGRWVHPLGDRFWFRVPIIAEWMTKLGVVPADPKTARDFLMSDHAVGTGPGGMWEALRPSRDRFRLRWEGRRGFARLALETGTPVVLAACPHADLAYTIYESTLTDAAYRHLKFPLPIVRGFGPTLFPRPVKLTAHFSEVIPVAPNPQPSDEHVRELADALAARMRLLIDEALRT
jgi:1-acyl-sn-glycerol-3-phosphate acyltransferase